MKIEEVCEKLSLGLSTDLAKKNSDDQYFSAAILVPLIREKDQLSLLFEVRSANLAWQPGEICFPGGRIETTDENSSFAAVRETSEELCIETDKIKVLGSLYEIISPIGVRLYPTVAYLDINKPISPSAAEVSEVFTVPLEYLLAYKPIVAHMERSTKPLADFPFELLPNYSKEWKSRKNYQVLFYKYENYVIWGLTAQVLFNFLEVYRNYLKNAYEI